MRKTARQPSKPKAATPPAKAGKRKPYGFRTVELGVVPELQETAQALAVGSKEVWNVCAYLIRHVHMAHEWDKASKTHLRIDMSEWEKEKRQACQAALAEADALAGELNEERAAKTEDGGKAAKPLPRLGPSVDGLDKLLTDASFMERFAKAHADGLRKDRQPAFLRLPFLIARNAVGSACDALKGRRQAMISWTPGDPIPKLPGYRREAASFAFEWSKRPHLADLSGLELHTDIERTVLLSIDAKLAWRSFGIHGHVTEALAARYGKPPAWMARAPTIEDVTMLRFVPAFQGGRPVHRLQAVVSLPAQPFPAETFLHDLSSLFQRKFKRMGIADAASEALGAEADAGMGIDWASEATPKVDPGKFDQGAHFGKAVKAEAMDAWLREILACQTWRRTGHSSSDKACTWVSRRYTACFVDPGVNNLATVGFANGLPGTVLSGGNFERALGRIDKKIDKLGSEGLQARGRELQSKRDKLRNERVAAEALRAADPKLAALAPDALRLSKKEAQELRGWFALAAKTPKLRLARRQRKEFIRSQAHQLAAEIVREAIKANAAFIVLGKNPGWKEGSNMGAEQNRRFHSFPHSLAWKLVAEKAWVQGIATLETEESHTSRTSFVHGDLMEVHPAKAAKRKAKAFKGKASAKAKAKSKAPRAFLRSPKSSPQGTASMKASFQARVEDELSRQEPLNQQPKTAAPQASGARGGQGRDRHRFSFAREAPTRAPRLPPALKTQGKPIAGPPSKTRAERRALWLSHPRTPQKWKRDGIVDGRGLGGMHADLNAAYNIGRKACPLFAFHHGLSLAVRVREHMWREDAKGWRPIHLSRRPKPKAKPSPAA